PRDGGADCNDAGAPARPGDIPSLPRRPPPRGQLHPHLLVQVLLLLHLRDHRHCAPRTGRERRLPDGLPAAPPPAGAPADPGRALAVPLLGVLSPPGCVMLAGLAFVLAALRLAVRSRPLLALAVPLAGLLLLAAILSDRLPDPVPDPVKTMNPLGGPGPMLF